LGNSFGQSYVDADVPTRQRMNWKSIVVDVGANIAALDYITNLVSRWAFGGSLNDSQGSNNGTGVGSPTYINGVYGQAISLNGSSQYVTVNDASSLHLSAFSISGWIYPTAVGTLQAVLTKGVFGNARNYSIALLANGKLELAIGNGTTTLTLDSVTVLSNNTWYHFIATFDGTSVWKIYINGVLDSSQTSAITPNQNTSTLYIGSNNGANYFSGQIDQLQIFSGDVSSAAKQIYSDCHSGMLAYCTVTGSSFTAGVMYRRNVENTAWEQVVDLTSTQTLSNKALDNTCSIAQDMFSIFLQQQANVIVNALYQATSSLYVTSNSGSGSITASYTTTENRIDVATGTTAGSTAQVVLPSGTFDGSTYITNSPNNNQWFAIAGLEARGTTNASDYMEVCICSNTLLSNTKQNSFGLFASGTGNWQAYAANNSSSFTNVDTGIANTAAVYGVMANFLAANTVKVYANHVLKATITTSVPNSGAGTVLRAFVQNGSTNNRILTVVPAMILAGVKA